MGNCLTRGKSSGKITLIFTIIYENYLYIEIFDSLMVEGILYIFFIFLKFHFFCKIQNKGKIFYFFVSTKSLLIDPSLLNS